METSGKEKSLSRKRRLAQSTYRNSLALSKHLSILLPGGQRASAVAVLFGWFSGQESQPQLHLTIGHRPAVQQQEGPADAVGSSFSAGQAARRAARALALRTMNSLFKTNSCCNGTVVTVRWSLVMLASGKSKRRSREFSSCRLMKA